MSRNASKAFFDAGGGGMVDEAGEGEGEAVRAGR